MKDLIAKLETETEGDRDFDWLILRVIDPDANIYEKDGFTYFESEMFDCVAGSARRYTTSIDAALTLVPVSWNRRLSEDDNGKWWAELREGYETSFARVFTASRCGTPALAMCVAALKARDNDPEN